MGKEENENLENTDEKKEKALKGLEQTEEIKIEETLNAEKQELTIKKEQNQEEIEKEEVPKEENWQETKQKEVEEDLKETKKENSEESKEIREDSKKSEKKIEKEQKEKKKETKKKERKEEKQIVNSTENLNERIQEQKETSQKKEKKKVGIIIAIATIVITIMLFSVIFALLNINNQKILKNISILGIDVGNLTIEEASQRLNDAIEDKFNNENDNIILKHGDEEVSVDANTFNASFDINSAIAEAYNIGRDKNIIYNNYKILWTKFFPKEINPTLEFDTELVQSTISDINSKMKDAVVEYSYYIEDNNLYVVPGKAGYIIKEEELKNKILEQIENIHTTYQEIEIPVEPKEPNSIDLQKIRNEIYKEPQDAYVEKNPTKVHPEVNGVDFGISMEEAQKLLQEEKEEYKIPLKITKPKKTLANLGEEAFPDQLATFTTFYDASSTNRSHNIQLASQKISGTIVMPGETFSYNTTTGKRTIEAGYKEGTAYIGGKVVPDIGGGVCQVSSTLYNTALYANLEITERSNHVFLTGYVPASRDATVYYGSLDFCFKNTRTYPIKIVASAKNGACKVSIYGIKEKVEYEVVLQSKITSYINYKTTYKEDATLAEGKEVVEQAGHNGCRSEGYKVLKLNGKIVSKTLLSKDSYSPMERIVRRGTKKVTTNTTTQ